MAGVISKMNQGKEMNEITFDVERDDMSGLLVATWEDSAGGEGITTRARDSAQLQKMVKEAVKRRFDEGQRPTLILLHFIEERTYVSIR